MMCNTWHIMKNIQVDHIIECGSIKSFEDIGPFLERLLCEKSGFQVLCLDCHRKKTYNYNITKENSDE